MDDLFELAVYIVREHLRPDAIEFIDIAEETYYRGFSHDDDARYVADRVRDLLREAFENFQDQYDNEIQEEL